MADESAEGGRDAANAVALLPGAAIIGLYLWSWWTFSGPFRWLIDIELRLFSGYWEPATGLVLGIVTAVAAWFAVIVFKRIVPSVSPWIGVAAVALAMLSLSAAALSTAWLMWNHAIHLPDRQTLAHTVDLDRLGDATPPLGHVRLIGVADRARMVLINYVGRNGHGHYDAWIPLTGQQTRNATIPVRFLATRRGSTQSDAAQGVPDSPEGILLADALDTRTRYQLRQKGLDVAAQPLVLFWPGDDVADDSYIGAAILALFILVFWSFTAYSLIAGRRGKVPRPEPAWSARVSPQPAEAVRSETAHRPLLVSTTVASQPNAGTAMLYVIRDQRVSGNSYIRVDVDGVRVAVLKANQYTEVVLQAGAHVLAINGRVSIASDTVARFEVRAGETVMYQLRIPFIGRPRLDRVADAGVASERLARLKKV